MNRMLEVRPGEGVSGMRGGPPPPPPPKEGELHCLYNQQDSGFVTAKFIWPEVRRAGFPPGEVAEQQGVAFCLNQDLGGFQDGESG